MVGPVAGVLTLEAVILGWLGAGPESELEEDGILAGSGSCSTAGFGSRIRVIIVDMARTRLPTLFSVSSRGEYSWEDGA